MGRGGRVRVANENSLWLEVGVGGMRIIIGWGGWIKVGCRFMGIFENINISSQTARNFTVLQSCVFCRALDRNWSARNDIV